MPEQDGSAGEQPTQSGGGGPADEQVKPIVTRRDFKFLGTRPPRVQGLGVVSDSGQYTQNINKGNSSSC